MGLLSPRNFPKKFRPDPSTFYLVIVVAKRQTDRQTYAGDSIIPRESFRGDNNDQHVLHQLLPPPKQISYNLRSRGHGITLSAIPSEFMRKNFLYRILYKDIY